MKTIVTHIGPDLDAIAAVWLVKTYFPGWAEASLAFVPAGSTMGGNPPDTDPEIIHVDTGFGKFDHHQSNENTCATMRVYDAIKVTRGADVALERMVAVINDIDHFREVFFPSPTADFWEMGIVAAIDGWRLIYTDNPVKIVDLGMDALDGIYKTFQNKVWAEKEIAAGVQFDTKWGKTIAMKTVNDEAVHLGQKMGFALVIRLDPNKGYLRIKSLPKPEIDLEPAYKTFKSLDPQATWFLHASHHMILNGSAKNPSMKPTTLPLEKIMEILKSQK